MANPFQRPEMAAIANAIQSVTDSKTAFKAPPREGSYPDIAATKRDFEANPVRFQKDLFYHARRVARAVASRVSPGALGFYERLLQASYRKAALRRYMVLPTTETLFCPIDDLALEFAVHRHTIRNWAKELVRAGVLAFKAQVVRVGGAKLHSGTVWFVNTVTGARKPRVRYEDMREVYRDMEGDLRAGNTCWSRIRHTKASGQLNLYRSLEDWLLPPVNSSTPLLSLYGENPSSTLFSVLEIPVAEAERLSELIERAGRAIVAALGDDPLKVRAWYDLLWQLRRLSDRGQDYFELLYLQLRRALDGRERGTSLKKPGAFAHSLIKKIGLWDAARSVPRWRVSKGVA